MAGPALIISDTSRMNSLYVGSIGGATEQAVVAHFERFGRFSILMHENYCFLYFFDANDATATVQEHTSEFDVRYAHNQAFIPCGLKIYGRKRQLPLPSITKLTTKKLKSTGSQSYTSVAAASVPPASAPSIYSKVNPFNAPRPAEEALIAAITAKLAGFIVHTGSTETEYHTIGCLKEVDPMYSKNILKVLNKSPGEVIEKYKVLFDDLKGNVTERIDLTKDEKNAVHPLVNQILMLLLNMVQSANSMWNHRFYHLKHETREGTIENDSFTRIPDFDLHFLPSDLKSSEKDLCSSLVCGEAQLHLKRSKPGILQALHYVALKIQAQLELVRDVNESYMGLCFFTQGTIVKFGRMTIDNGTLKIVADYDTKEPRLWYDNDGNAPSGVADAVSFLRLLGVFDSSPSQLGYKVYDNMFGVQNYRSVRVLGFGSFSSCVEVSYKGKNYAIKAPKYTRPIRAQNETAERLKHEVSVLKLLSGVDGVKQFVPSIGQRLTKKLNTSRAIVLREVGITLVTAVAQNQWAMTHRVLLGKELVDVLGSMLAIVHSMGLCHCDIAPDNIILVPCNDSGTLPRLLGEFNLKPVLIDWELSRNVGQPFHAFKGRINLLHDDVVKAHTADSAMPKTTPEFDIDALRYTVASFVYSEINMTAPWADFGMPYDDEFYQWREKMTVECFSKRYSREDKKSDEDVEDLW